MSYHKCPLCGNEGSFVCKAIPLGGWKLATVDESDNAACCSFSDNYANQQEAEKAAAEVDLHQMDEERNGIESDDYGDCYDHGYYDCYDNYGYGDR